MSDTNDTKDHTIDYKTRIDKAPETPGGDELADDDVSSITSLSLATDDSRITRLAKLRTDQHRRFQQGVPISVERYLEQFAAQIDSETAVDLIYSEVLLRAHSGDNPTVDEYVNRFPQYAEPLRQQFEVFNALQSVLFSDAKTNGSNNEEKQTAAGVKGSVKDLPQIPGYEILSQLGRGGMGVVWKAKQLGLNRIVALKMLHIGNDAELVTRFRTEAETIARLRHANIVQIFDVGEIDGKPYYSMEFVDGGTLAENGSGAPFPVRQAAQLTASLARAVHAAHECSVIHRDLKPANILLQKKAGGDAELIPKVADFGLAKQLDQAGDLTASGALMGTPNYMAPEQAEGRTQDIGPAVDIHALGCVLYQLLTGRKAFQGRNVVETLTHIRTQEPTSPSKYNPRVHRDLETICLKCLQKSPGRRYATAEALADDLQRFLDGEPIQARRVSRFERLRLWCRRHPATAVAGLAAMFLAFVVLPGWLWYQAELRASQEREHLTKQAANSSEKARQSAEELARTQEYFALVHRTKQRSARKRPGWTWAGLQDLKRAAQLDTKAPDIGDLRAEAARCLSGIDVRLQAVWAEKLPQVMIAFSPDGRYLAVADYRASGFVFPCSVRLLDGHTGKTVRKLSFPSSLVFKENSPVPDGARSVAFTPDSKQLLVGTRSGRIYRWSLANPAAKPMSWKVTDGGSVDWMLTAPDGNSVIVGSSHERHIARWKLSHGMKTPSTQFDASDNLKWLALSPNGQTLVYNRWGGGPSFLDAKLLEPLKNSPKTNADLPRSLSPFVFDRTGEMLYGESYKGFHLIQVRSKRIGQTMNTDGRGGVSFQSNLLRVNPNGSLLLALGYTDGDRRLQLWETASGRLQFAAAFPGRHFADAAFHPTKDAFVLANDDKLELYEIGGLRMQTRIANQALPVEAFAHSPDGERLTTIGAKEGPEGHYNDVRAISHWQMDTGKFMDLFPDHHGAFNRPPKSLVATHPRTSDMVLYSDMNAIDFRNYEKKTPQRLLRLPSPTALAFDRDGKRLWIIADEQSTLYSYTWPQVKKASTWQDTIRLAEGSGQLYSLAAESKTIVVGSRDGVTHLIHGDSGQLIRSLAGRRSPVQSVAVNGDETLAVSGYQDGKVRVHRISSGEFVCDLDDHADTVESIDFSSDGKLLATGSRDGTMHMYAVDGSSVHKLMTFDSGPVRQLRFHKDGRRLVYLVDGENGIRIWHLDRLRTRLKELHADLDW